MDEVKWMHGILWFGNVLIATMADDLTGWGVVLNQEGDFLVVHQITLPVAKHLIGGWCLAVTGQECPEEGAPWNAT